MKPGDTILALNATGQYEEYTITSLNTNPNGRITSIRAGKRLIYPNEVKQ